MADINSELLSRHRAPADKAEQAAAGRRRSPAHHLRRAAVLRLPRLHARGRRRARRIRPRPRAPPRAALRQPSSGPAGRRPARDPEDHQAEPGPRAEAARRRGLDRAEGRRATIAASGCCTRPRRARPWPRRLDSLQAKRVAQALWQPAGPATRRSCARFLFAMISQEERALVEALLPEPVEAAAAARD